MDRSSGSDGSCGQQQQQRWKLRTTAAVVAEAADSGESYGQQQRQRWNLRIAALATVEATDSSSGSGGGSSKARLSMAEEPAVISLNSGRNYTWSDSGRKLWALVRLLDLSVDDRGRLGPLRLRRRQGQKALASLVLALGLFSPVFFGEPFLQIPYPPSDSMLYGGGYGYPLPYPKSRMNSYLLLL
ncbi:hypothetical protein MUK42_16620 [Musa troglodytarum]|uniref:Uncharacterized protein n=1 Tax=Musa troglodytarum TaxID=320322 RepID=A0A9E7HS16_9LILI|nr:hypothetical protein MUK42_16620 [Musa troglodytarum]